MIRFIFGTTEIDESFRQGRGINAVAAAQLPHDLAETLETRGVGSSDSEFPSGNPESGSLSQGP